jgi:hypothetical protein
MRDGELRASKEWPRRDFDRLRDLPRFRGCRALGLRVGVRRTCGADWPLTMDHWVVKERMRQAGPVTSSDAVARRRRRPTFQPRRGDRMSPGGVSPRIRLPSTCRTPGGVTQRSLMERRHHIGTPVAGAASLIACIVGCQTPRSPSPTSKPSACSMFWAA